MMWCHSVILAVTSAHGNHTCSYEQDSMRRGADLMMTSASKVEECCDQCVQSWTGQSGETISTGFLHPSRLNGTGCVAFTFEPKSGVCYLETGDGKSRPPDKKAASGSISGIVIGKIVQILTRASCATDVCVYVRTCAHRHTATSRICSTCEPRYLRRSSNRYYS